jgi:hypothetical protein
MFQVPRSMKGGIANCPRCQQAVDIPGGPEGLFYVLLFIGIAVVVGILALFFAASTKASSGNRMSGDFDMRACFLKPP